MAADLDRREIGRTLSLVGELGLTVVLALMLPALGGRWLDRWLGTGRLLTLAGGLVGLAAGLLQCYRRLSRFLE